MKHTKPGEARSTAPTSSPHIWATNHSNPAGDGCCGLEGTGCRQSVFCCL